MHETIKTILAFITMLLVLIAAGVGIINAFKVKALEIKIRNNKQEIEFLKTKLIEQATLSHKTTHTAYTAEARSFSAWKHSQGWGNGKDLDTIRAINEEK